MKTTFVDVLLGALAIVVMATVLGLVSNHYVRRPVVLLPVPKASPAASAPR